MLLTERMTKGEESKSALILLQEAFMGQDWLIQEGIQKIVWALKQTIEARQEGDLPWNLHMQDLNRLTFLARNLDKDNLQRLQQGVNTVSIFFQLTCENPKP